MESEPSTRSARRRATSPIRHRFVMRARHLKGRREFREALDRERAAWDMRFPAFAVGKVGLPPEETLAGYCPELIAFPPPLKPAAWAASEAGVDGDLAKEDPAVREAINEWIVLVMRLADEWWPADIFPVWMSQDFGHPAGPFVAACLVWRLEVVSEDWILRACAGSMIGFPHDPVLGPDPRDLYWSTYIEHMEAEFTAAATAGEVITEERLARLRLEAESAAEERRVASYPSDRKDWFWVVPVVPGITSTEWRSMESWVLDHLAERFGPDALMRHAHRLRGQGMSARRIALELGISERHAGRLLKSEEEPPPHCRAGMRRSGLAPEGGAA